ncbi:MAG: HAMP domain-containing histidine kinase [Bacteroidales bacterium]|nr:HAMP domain-containing histidine kinase [Bacteroidales bacterium]
MLNKKLIWFIILLISSSTLLLILYQLYWIQQEYKIQEERFNQNVTSAINSFNRSLEARETVVEINREIFSLKYNVRDIPFFYSYLQKDEKNNDFYYDKRQISIRDTNTIISSTQIDILKGDSVIFSKTIKKDKPYFIFTNNKNDDFNINKEIVKRLTNKTLFIEKIINKMFNYYDNFKNRVDYQTFSSLLDKSLKQYGINLKYEYAVKDDKGNIIYKTPKYNENYYDIYKFELFPQDFFLTQNFLVLYFPEKQKYIYKSFGLMSVINIFIALIVIFTFIFTVYVIFKQKKLSQMKTEFVNNMTHELKTPLSSIILASEMISDATICQDANKTKKISEILKQESNRLNCLVEKILQVALFEKGQYHFKKQLLNVNDIIKNIYNIFEFQVKSKNGKLTLDLKAQNDTIYGDELHISNCIINLLDNAIKYSKENPQINILTYNVDNKIVISVKDNGIGISKKDQKHIFDSFFRVSTGNVHNIKGFGIGLSYVKLISKEHNGEVKVKSELNKGSEFQIILPIVNHQKK